MRTDTHRYTEADLAAIRASLASDERLSARHRQRFAAMTDAELVAEMDIISEYQSLPARERKAVLVLAKRLALGDDALHRKLQAANRGEVPHEQLLEEVLA